LSWRDPIQNLPEFCQVGLDKTLVQLVLDKIWKYSVEFTPTQIGLHGLSRLTQNLTVFGRDNRDQNLAVLTLVGSIQNVVEFNRVDPD